MSEHIEFYKNRSIGERFSVAIYFLKQNWKVLYKNILLGGLPLAIILAIIMSLQPTARLNTVPELSNSLFYLPFQFFFTFANIVYLYSMTSALLLHYNKNKFSETTGWDDLKDTFFNLSGKTILISLVVLIPITIIVVIIGAFIAVFFSTGIVSAGAAVFPVILIILLFAVLLIIAPIYCLLYFPAYFSEKGIIESIIISFKLGFKNWASLFVAVILTSVLYFVIHSIFSAPFEFIKLFLSGNNSILKFVFANLSTVGTLLLYPVMIIVYAFQYFSIVEKEEGISLRAQIEDFENM